MGTTYAVPYPPTTPGAVDYIFTDFQDHALTSILQPVVGFGPTAGENGSTIGGNYMWQAPYYLWSGNLAVGDLQQVYTNDTIGGSLTSSGCNSGGGHCNWNIAVHDLTTGHLISSTLAINSSAVYSVFDGAVLEADAMGCKELFSNHHAVFRNISGTSQGGAVSPSWNFYTDGQCSMYLTGSGANLDILWTS